MSNLQLTKREFLKYGTSLMTAAALPYTYQVALAKEQWDTIIIGAGTAGIPAAIFAAERGLKVLVIEKASVIGGTLFVSTGQISGAGTVFQERKGIKDSPDQHFDDIMRINNNTSDPALTRILADHAGPTINWLAANGYTIFENHPVKKMAHDAFSVARYQQGPKGATAVWGGGLAILNTMKPLFDKQVSKGSITILLETSAVDLIQARNGEINGVIAQNREGKSIEYKGRSVILASGGCASNPRMYEELHGIPLYCQMAYPQSQGAGLILGQSVGGYLRGGEKYSPLYGMILSDDKVPSTPYGVAINAMERQPWEILINSEGKRFVREDHESIDHIEHQIGKQSAHRHWTIMDQRMLNKMSPMIYDWSNERIAKEADNHVMFKSGSSIRELAIKTGLHPVNLENTVNDFNSNIKNKQADSFGRLHRPLAIDQGPYYSVQMSGWSLCSFAGLGVNKNFEVVRPSGEPIKNLYAIGEVIGFGATSGNAYVNGMGVTPALTYGRLLGQRI